MRLPWNLRLDFRMAFEPAPYHASIVAAPLPAAAYWVRTSDGVRIRVCCWRGGERGTVVLFPGRTEYIEKYADVAGELARCGFGVAAVDWRCHGLSDRLSRNRHVCHVSDFDEYQRDVAAFMSLLAEVEAPRPWFLLAHSMGGCIGLRALLNGMDVSAAVFIAPMWRVRMGRVMRHATFVAARAATWLGLSKRFVAGADHRNHVHYGKSRKIVLTSDVERFESLRAQIELRPELSLGGPSYGWVDAALRECRGLLSASPPSCPALVFIGTKERVVDRKAVRIVCAKWPAAKVEAVENARHEILMETEAVRDRAIARIAVFFESCREAGGEGEGSRT